MNTQTSLCHLELVNILGEDGKVYFGGKTDWFPSPEKRHLHGGAATAAEMISYLAATRKGMEELYPEGRQRTQAEFEGLMERVWDYLIPDEWEHLTLKNYVDGLTAFVEHAGHPLNFNVLDIPHARAGRPSADRCFGFIDDAMKRDSPVAFLRHSRGEREGEVICDWSIIVGRRGNLVVFAEDGEEKTMDLRLWAEITSLGGALVFAIRHPLN